MEGILLVGSVTKRVLDFFDTASGERLGRTTVLAEPHEMAPDEGRRVAYLTHTYRSGVYGQDDVENKGHEISVVDVDKQSIVEMIDISPYVGPHDIEYDPVKDLIYVGVEENADGQKGVLVVDPNSRHVVDVIETGPPNAHWLALTPDGTRAYVSHKDAGCISILDLDRRTAIGQIAVAGGTEEVDVSSDGQLLFVAAPTVWASDAPESVESSRVVMISVASNELYGEIELEPVNIAVRVVPDGRVLVTQMRTPAGSPWSLKVIEPSSHSIVAAVEMDRMPFTIRVSPDSRYAFVAHFGAGTVSMVDLDSYEVSRTFECTPDPAAVGGTHAMCLMASSS